MSYYDDNYGHYKIESDEDVEFYHQVQRNSVTKTCSCCGRKVRIQSHYDKCNSCADKIERGWDF